MSIHQLAHHLQSAGRGEDKVLVHMTPKEVNGLQALAMAHGGSLTINPKTGLPEAGFLKAILPMVAGFFLGPAGLGVAKTALGAGAMVGAATGIATGSLSKGLMAGLGAYGGFGLAESLAGAGAAANAAKAGVSTIDDVAAAKAAQLQGTGGIQNKLSDALGATTNTGASGVSQVSNINQPLAKPFASGFQNAGDVMRGGLATPPQVQAATDVVLQAPNPIAVQTGTDAAAKLQQVGGAGGYGNKLTDALGATKAAPVTNFENVKAGFNDVTSSGTKAWEFVKKNPTPFIGAGLGLLSEFSNSGNSPSGAKKQPGMIRPYEYSVAQNQSAYAPTDSTAERTYFTEPRFVAGTPYAAKEGGIMGYAVGGPVEQMSAQNAVGDNTMYPQSQLQTPMYSNPMVQRPMSTNVIQSGLDAPVGAYTGEMKMALGGSATAKSKEPTKETKYSFDPATQQYTQSTTTTPATSNNMQDAVRGFYSPVFDALPHFRTMGGGKIPGLDANSINKFKQQIGAPQPTTTTETSGGVAAPYIPRNQEVIAQTPAPAVNIPQYQSPEQQLGLSGFYNMMGDQLAMKGAQMQSQGQGFAVGGSTGGISDLGGYSDGGRLLKGPGDGVSDSIPASIGDRQPARLADGEFVVPARIVSEIGNGSTEAGARKLYAMMDRVQHARKKTVGKNQVAKNTKADKLLPA
jgi:hypothetical protein